MVNVAVLFSSGIRVPCSTRTWQEWEWTRDPVQRESAWLRKKKNNNTNLGISLTVTIFFSFLHILKASCYANKFCGLTKFFSLATT